MLPNQPLPLQPRPQTPQATQPLMPQKKRNPKKMIQLGVLIASAVIIVSALIFTFYKLGFLNFWSGNNDQAQEQLNKEDQKMLEQLKKIILLPDDVVPTMAIINDADVLKKTQPEFFANAKDGQRVIIYSDQAILYDAEAKQIIKVGPVNNTVQTVNFAVYNSLTDEKKITELENKLSAAFNNAVVTIKENSAKKNYAQTLVIDLLGNNPEIEKIAQAIDGEVAPLPEGEKRPEGVSVLIIIGQK